jgi:hypothetical protein
MNWELNANAQQRRLMNVPYYCHTLQYVILVLWCLSNMNRARGCEPHSTTTAHRMRHEAHTMPAAGGGLPPALKSITRAVTPLLSSQCVYIGHRDSPTWPTKGVANQRSNTYEVPNQRTSSAAICRADCPAIFQLREKQVTNSYCCYY